MSTHDYTAGELAEALAAAGVCEGDIVFSHSNVGYFGMPDGPRTKDNMLATIHRAFLEVLGAAGTLVVPTFTYSLCAGKVFDRERTPSGCGMFTEYVRTLPDSVRSADPIFSVAATGGQADGLVADVSMECFGEDSFWGRFFRADGKICNLNFDAGSTFVHYVEKRLGVPYRSDKVFSGTVILNGLETPCSCTYFCQTAYPDPDTAAAFEPLDALLRRCGLARTATVGKGAVVCVGAQDVARAIEETLPSRPWLLTEQGRKQDECDGNGRQHGS